MCGTSKPLAIDLFCGLGGWTEGLLAEGYRVVGFDNERHVYGDHCYPAQLVLQDVLTIHGRQLKDAALIVASPPCQEFSYMAMPWSRAKQKMRDYESGVRDVRQLTALFDACFRIRREASEAAGRHIPLVIENVRGAQKWVGCSRWNFGSFHLWGDVPALMPMTLRRNELIKRGDCGWRRDGHKPGVTYKGKSVSFDGAVVDGHIKVASEDGGRRTDVGNGVRFTSREEEGVKANEYSPKRKGYRTILPQTVNTGSKSPARKAASAMIAKIPLVLARHIAKSWHPGNA